MFQELTETLTCEISTLAYPKAAIFAFCLAVAAYNGISVIKAALRSAHGTDVVEEQVSGYYISLEISKSYTGMMIAIPAEEWSIFADMTVAQLARELKQLAGRVDLAKYQRHRRGQEAKTGAYVPRKVQPPIDGSRFGTQKDRFLTPAQGCRSRPNVIPAFAVILRESESGKCE